MPNNAMIPKPEPARLPVPLQTALTAARSDLTPIDPKALAVMLKETLALWPLPAEFDTTAKFYREALQDVPLDLVETALRHVRLSSRFFPRPAEIRDAIRDELARRRMRLDRAEREARQHESRRPAYSPQENAEMAAKFRDLGQMLKRLEAHSDDMTT